MSISLRVTRARMSVCLVLSVIFCKLINEGSWGATCLRQILFQIREKTFTETFQMLRQERTVWAVRNVTSGTGVSNRAERLSKTSPNLDGIPRQWTTITLRKCSLWFVKNRHLTVRAAAAEVGICKSSCHPDFDLRTEDASCCRKICAASADASLLIHEFLTKHETTVVPPPIRPTLQICPLRTFSCSRSGNPH